MIRLGLNIDHVATLRNARGGEHPNPLNAALLACQSGADGITVHLREDRRHIRDADVYAIKEQIDTPLNLEMAVTEEMLKIACEVKPHACCIVPEKREEITTEGGLNAAAKMDVLKPFVSTLKKAGIKVSLFIDPDVTQVEAARELDVPIVEFHTGTYCHSFGTDAQTLHLKNLVEAARVAHEYGIECHAGHGLTYGSAHLLAQSFDHWAEFNIGHFLMGEAIFEGLPIVISKMKAAINQG